jgi:hypothetical protein
VAARAEIKLAAEQYKAGQKDTAYETAANAYLNRFENLEADLEKVDAAAVPAIEADFKALRDGIKAGQVQTEIDAIVARLDAALAKAAGQLPGAPAVATVAEVTGKMSPQVLITQARAEIKQAAEQYKAGQ